MNEWNVLFDGIFNTFYLGLCGIEPLVKNHIDSERGNLLSPFDLHFPIKTKQLYIYIYTHTYIHRPIDWIVHTAVFGYTSCGALVGMKNGWIDLVVIILFWTALCNVLNFYVHPFVTVVHSLHSFRPCNQYIFMLGWYSFIH